jgi:hypothetical protein
MNNDMMKVYIGYGYTACTTGAFLETAFRRFAQVVYVGTDKKNTPSDFQEPDAVSLMSGAGPNDVFFYIESGVKFFPRNIEKLPCLTACYLIDVHVDIACRIEMAKFFDVVFIAQKDYVEVFRKRGIQNVWWLPLASDPDIYWPLDLTPEFDIGFVGHTPKDVPRRRRFLSILSQKYHVNDFGRSYSPEESAQVYGRSKIVFNCSVRGDLNMRVFEGMSCGRLLVTDAISNGLEELFLDRKHLVIYRNEKELLGLVDYYLAHDEDRELIARAGLNLAHSEHTYKHRVKKVLEVIRAAQEGPERFCASWRKARAPIVSTSRAKIYAAWRFFPEVREEWREPSDYRSFIIKTFYLCVVALSLLKSKLFKKAGRK